MHRKPILGAAIALALAAPAAAHAHVTIQPSQATAGGFTVESVRVPNERDDAATTKVAVQFPPGFASASYEATPGWTVNVQKSKLAQPVKTGDGEITDQVSRITWTADSKADAIQPGQFRDFPLSVKIPDAAGQRLTFKALQTYDNGEIVRWIGTPDSDTPAPQLTVLPAASGDGGGHASAGTAPGAASEPVAATAGEAGGKASKGLAIAALVVGALGLAAGAAALVTRRRA